MSDRYFENGHPRTRGARSSFKTSSEADYPFRFGSVPSFDETPIFYCEEGEGEPLVFCYGIACSTLHWTYQIDYFRKNYRCIWFDYRGHGQTPLPSNSSHMSVEACARDLQAVLDFLDIKNATLLGHSMGVSVVLQFARMFPERVTQLVVANGTAKRPLDTLLGGNFLTPAFQILSRYEKENPSLIHSLWKLQEKTPLVASFLGTLGFNRALTHPDDIKTYARQIAALNPAVLTTMMDDYQHFDATPWLDKLKTKTLILSGEDDRVTPPATQDLMAQLMPNAQLVRVQSGSHCSTLDLPDYVSLLIERFLKS
jgi:pimeloyl-ACP methyl ester carboxylesterase